MVYFPWDIDRTFWEVLSTDHGKLLRNAVEWATDEEPPVSVSGRGVLDVTIWRQKQSMTVHLVNLTNPMMMKGPVREIIPIGPLRVRIRVASGATVTHVHTLVNRGQRAFRVKDGFIHLDVPSVGIHEVVAVDLAQAEPRA